MLGRKLNASPQSDGEFRSSIKNYYESQLRRKRLSDGPQVSYRRSTHDHSSLSQFELKEIEESTFNDLLSRLSVHKQKTSPNTSLNVSLSPIRPAIAKPEIQQKSETISGKKSVHFEDVAPKLRPTSSNNLSNFTPPQFTSISAPILAPSQPIFAPKPIQTNPIFSTPQQPIVQPTAFLYPSLSSIQNKSPSLFSSSPQNPTIEPIKPIEQPTTITILQPFFTQQPLQKPEFFNKEPLKVIETKELPKPIIESPPELATVSTSQNNEQQPAIVRQRRPSKSETPESSKFSHWLKMTLKAYDEYLDRLKEFKSNTAILPICNNVRMAVQETIDVHTSDNARDIQSISAALIFFEDLYKTGAAKKGDQPLPLTNDGKLFITMCICERYLKRVVGQDTCISFVATLFLVLIKKEPEIFNVLLSMVFSKCVLPHLDAKKCLEHVIKLSNGPAEESAQWVSEEYARFRLLAEICSMTTMKNQEILRGLNLLQFFLNEALRGQIIPISTPFVINTILSINLSNYQKRFPSEFTDLINKSNSISELDWPIIIRQTLDNSELKLTDRAITLITAKNSVLIQNLKSTIVSIKH